MSADALVILVLSASADKMVTQVHLKFSGMTWVNYQEVKATGVNMIILTLGEKIADCFAHGKLYFQLMIRS